MVSALPLGLFITLDEFEITSSPICFFWAWSGGRSLTDDSSAKRNALEMCWLQGMYIHYFNLNLTKIMNLSLNLIILTHTLFFYPSPNNFPSPIETYHRNPSPVYVLCSSGVLEIASQFETPS